ncbi:MAG: PAS domain-containing protein [Sandaracinaceae bacterium]|nr:PAS domain-containing protein [Sandaracinaceae bacterium]
MSATRELAFRTAVLLAVASGVVATASALGVRGTPALAATGMGALATVVYLLAAAMLRSGRGLELVTRAIAIPLAVAVSAWAWSAEWPVAGAGLTVPALVAGLAGRPVRAGVQGAVCVALAAAVALRVGIDARWGIAVACTTIAAVAGVLVAMARGRAGASSPLGRALFSSLPMGVLIVEAGRVVRANPAIGALTRQAPEALVGLPLLHVIAPADRDAVEKHVASTEARALDVRVRRADGTLCDATLTVAPLDALQLVLVQDRSDRAKAERAKDEFLSTVSHELRTPLASIHGALGLIEGGAAGEVSDKAHELVALGRRNTDRLLRLVNDLLDLKRLEAGRMKLRRRALDPAESVKAALDGLAVIAADAGVELEARGGTALSIWADPDRVVQVLTNLVSNAIKFSPEGSAVTVSIAHRARFVRFTVSDRGPGIPEDEQERLFSRFQQLDQSDARSIQGSGLGLAIAQAIVRQHGGEIGIESAAEGTTFYFELPVAEADSDSMDMDSVVVPRS